MDKRAIGGVLERLERGIRLERLGQCLRALGTNVVGVEAASESRPQVSGAADTCQIFGRGVALLAHSFSTPDALEGGVDLEHLGNLDDALSSVDASAI